MKKYSIKKIFIFVFIVTIVTASITYLYPKINGLILVIRSHSYVYSYKPSEKIVAKDVSSLEEALSVPFLMYHGIVVQSALGENTDRKTFISQMEMLKREGYQTISVKEYDLWREGKFTLPPKPIVITFDDGRKDSYFTTDEVFRKLGFKATIFIATNSTVNDSFFLNWHTLKKMQSSGRWEIEAHGRDSHKKIVLDDKGNTGNYLASRIYSPEKGLESISDYEQRISREYANGKSDLLKNLGIDAVYFAIPLNSYGTNTTDLSNYSGAFSYNDILTRQYYKLAFIQAQSDENDVYESFYNYKDSNPYKIKRLQVKNMSPEKLLTALETFSEKPMSLAYPNNNDKNFIRNNFHTLYGNVKYDNVIKLTSDKTNESTRFVLGSPIWKNYMVKAEATKEKGKSFSVLVYYKDEDNYINLDWAEKSLKLTRVINGESKEIDSYYPFQENGKIYISFKLQNGFVSVYCNGILLKGFIHDKAQGGLVGFGVWDTDEAISTINKIEVTELK